jgi:hypothetical protein
MAHLFHLKVYCLSRQIYKKGTLTTNYFYDYCYARQFTNRIAGYCVQNRNQFETHLRVEHLHVPVLNDYLPLFS